MSSFCTPSLLATHTSQHIINVATMSPHPIKENSFRSAAPGCQQRTYIPLTIAESALGNVPQTQPQRTDDSENPASRLSFRARRRLSWTHFQNLIGALLRRQPSPSPSPSPSLEDVQVEPRIAGDGAKSTPSPFSLETYVLSSPTVKRLGRPRYTSSFAHPSSKGKRRKNVSPRYSQPEPDDDENNEQQRLLHNLLVCLLAILFIFFAVT
ncbi:hypothetical protein V9T40_014825 [Parthenolecanium corni]|uniref:Uncharacterized protein n=1 Tax=Parthenolecanium corni TaxID=536013 RepID=A0AAN9XY15_9HEMI